MTTEIPDHKLFDISDVDYDFIKTKSCREVVLRMKSGSKFNLFKAYLALKHYVERIETEIGITDIEAELQ